MLMAGVVIGATGSGPSSQGAADDVPCDCERSMVGREVTRALASGLTGADEPLEMRGQPAKRPAPRPSPPQEQPDEGASTNPSDEPPEPAPAERPDLAGDVLDLRREQAMAALFEQARPDRDQRIAIESIVEDMNESVSVIVSDMVDLMSSNEELTRLDWMMFASDFLEVFIETELALTDVLTDDQLGAIDAALVDPFSFVDRRVTEPLEAYEMGGSR